MTALFVIATSLSLVGLLLFLHGVIGRRIDDHPHCRKCGFDLFGRWPDIKNCPECGRELSGKEAVRNGTRRRNGWVIATGLLFVLLAAPLLSMRFTGNLTYSQIYHLAPFWFVRMEAESHDFLRSNDALREIELRIKRGEADDDQIRSIIPVLLKHQSNQDRIWMNQMGDMIETAHEQKLVTDAQWQQYINQAMRIEFVTRKKTRVRRAMPVHLTVSEIRLGSRNFHMKMAPISDGSFQVIGHTSIETRNWHSGENVLIPLSIYHNLAVDQHTINFKFKFTLNHAAGYEQFTRSLKSTIEVVEQDQPVIDVIHEDSLQRVYENAITVDRIEVDSPAGGDMRFAAVKGMIKSMNLPHPYGFEVCVRSGEYEWIVAHYYQHGGGSVGTEFMKPLTDFDPPFLSDIRAVDVILRGRPEQGEANPTIETMWGGDVTIKDVPVVW